MSNMTENNIFQDRNDLCRLCSSRSSLVSVFNGRFGMKENMAEVVEVTSGVKISPNDGVSHMLCSSCVHLSITLFKFRNNSIQNDMELKEKGIEKKSIHQSVKDLGKQNPSSIYGCTISPVVLIQKNITNNLKLSKIESLKRKKSCDQDQLIHTNNDQIIGNISKKFKSMDSASTSGLTISQTPECLVDEISSSNNEQGVHSGWSDPIGEKELDQETTLPFTIKPLTKAVFICEVCNKVHYNTKALKKHETTHMRCSLCRTTFRSMEETKKHEESCSMMKITNNQPKLIVERCDEIEDVRENNMNAFQKLIIEITDEGNESDNNTETTFSNKNENSIKKNNTESNEKYIFEVPYPEISKDNGTPEEFEKKYDFERSEQSNVKKPKNKESETSLRKSIPRNCKKIPEISGKLNNPKNSTVGKSKKIKRREICGEKYNAKNLKTVYNIEEFENPCNSEGPSEATTEIIKGTQISAPENFELISLLDDLETDPKDKCSEDSHETDKPENSEIESNFEDSTKISPLNKSQNVSDVKDDTRKSEETNNTINIKELATFKTKELYFNERRKSCSEKSISRIERSDELANIDETSKSPSRKNSCENIKRKGPKKKKFHKLENANLKGEKRKINEHLKDSKKLKVDSVAKTDLSTEQSVINNEKINFTLENKIQIPPVQHSFKPNIKFNEEDMGIDYVDNERTYLENLLKRMKKSEDKVQKTIQTKMPSTCDILNSKKGEFEYEFKNLKGYLNFCNIRVNIVYDNEISIKYGSDIGEKFTANDRGSNSSKVSTESSSVRINQVESVSTLVDKPMATTINDKKEKNDQHKEPIIISNPNKPTATTVDKIDNNNQQEEKLFVSFDNKNSNLTNEHADDAPNNSIKLLKPAQSTITSIDKRKDKINEVRQTSSTINNKMYKAITLFLQNLELRSI